MDQQRISARLRLTGRALAGLVVASVLALAVTFSAAALPPQNDNFANAITISGGSGTTDGTTVEATTEAGEPGTDLPLQSAGVKTSQTVWWKWTAPTSELYTFAATSTATVPTIGIFTGSVVDGLTEVRSDAGAGNGIESRLFFDAVAGTTYYVQVGVYPSTSPGAVTLGWAPNSVPNDNFANAISLGTNSGTRTGWTVGATVERPDEPGTSTCCIDHTVWYAFTPTIDGSAEFILNTDFSFAFNVYTGSTLASLKFVGSFQPFDVDAGSTYYIQVGTSDSNGGTFRLTWAFQPRPPNDDLANATGISGGFSQDGTTVAARIEPTEPVVVNDHTGVRSVWYRWSPGASGPATVSADALPEVLSVPLVQLYTGPATNPSFAALTAIGTHDPPFSDNVDTLHAAVDASQTYYIQVMGDFSSETNTSFPFTLTGSFDNDLFANAALIAGSSGSIGGSNVGATLEPGEPTSLAGGTIPINDTIWWKWVAPSSRKVEFDTVGTKLDTTIGIHTGTSVDALTEVTGDDDGGGAPASRASFTAVAGTTYYIQAGAKTAGSQGAIPLHWSSVPGAPTLDSATGGDGSVALAWTPPADDGGSPITGYRIWRGTSPGRETVLTDVGNVTSAVDSTVVNGTTYYYKVSALNDVGVGALSNERSATPAAVPGAPTLDSATSGNGSVALSWTAPASDGGAAITAYKVYRGTSSGAETLLTTVGNVTTYADSTVVNGTTYFYEVSAVNSAGESSVSSEFSATPFNPNLRAIAGSVRAASGSSVGGIAVRACLASACADTTTNSDGIFSFLDLDPGVYVVRALPSDPSVLAAQTTVDVTQADDREVFLGLATTGATGTAAGPSTFDVSGCVGGTLNYVATADGTRLGNGTVADAGPNGQADGVYVIDVSSLNPGHAAMLRLDLAFGCPDTSAPIELTAVLFADPSGTVVDDNAGGAALAGATVTLLDANGNAIPAGDPRLSPATPANPETSDARGAWGWDVAPGTYSVTATKSGCGTTTSAPLTVTPTNPVSSVVLHLSCGGGGGAAPPPPPPPPPSFPANPTPPATLPDPVPGVNFNVVPISGTVLVNGAVLPSGQQIPFGADIDASHGIVSITTIGLDGKPQTAFFYGGEFVLTLDPDGVTTLVLKGGDFSVCTPLPKKKAVTKKQEAHKTKKRKTQAVLAKAKSASTTVRALWGTGKGNFRTKGRFSSATVRGTLWYQADRCDGTYTQVNSGVVTVLDLVRNRTLIVRAGHSVLVRPK